MKRYMVHNKQVPMQSRVMRTRTAHPYITWIEADQAWRIQISKPVDGEKHLCRRFYVRDYDGSSSKCLAAAIKYRDANICAARLQNIVNHEATFNDDVAEVEDAKKYKPAAHHTNQFALWLHERKQTNKGEA